MKTISMRELNRRQAEIIDQVETGQTFELRRNGKTVAYLVRTCPPDPPKKEENIWDEHFRWLETQSKAKGRKILKAFEEERKRQRERHEYLMSIGKEK